MKMQEIDFRYTDTDYDWKEPKTPAHNCLLRDIEKNLNRLRLTHDANILDAGCGGGYIVRELYKKGYKNIWGFDASESGIEVAQRHFADIKERFKVHNAYNKELPESFPDKNYDLILSIEVIEHVYSPKEYIKNIKYWLKDSGFLIVTTPYHGYIKNLAIALLNRFDTHFNPLQEGEHIKFFSKNTIYKILKDAGFNPILFSGSGRMPYIWKSMIIISQKE